VLNDILLYALCVLIPGASGYLISYRFHRSQYARTDRSGDFGAARGSFLMVMSGALIGALLLNIAHRFGLVSPDAGATAFMLALGVGALSGVIGLFRGTSGPPRK